MSDAWAIPLTGAKFLFLGLIYLVLFLVVIAVQREMRRHVEQPEQNLIAPGQLEVVRTDEGSHLQPGQRFVLQNRTTIGAAPDNDVVLEDDYVSGDHARLRWDGAIWWIEDLGSRNGTTINGRHCTSFVEERLPAGAMLQLGDTTLQLLV